MSSGLSASSAKKSSGGVIYLSTIPYFMTAQRLRELLSRYGEVGRLYLRPETKRSDRHSKKVKQYCEGWVEFKDKKVAKRVAACLNNTMVGAKRRSKSFECLWNMKYLHRFKWVHLEEQLQYEKQVRKQKMRTEISQAKRRANFFLQQVEKGENLKRLEETVLKKGGQWEKYQRQVKQKQTIKEKTQDREKKDLILDMVLGE